MNKLDEALGLFPSAIKSGEQWSQTCQKVLEGAKAELSELRRRVVVLETVIYEDLSPMECSDGLNLMIVEDVIKRRSGALPNGERA